MPRRDETFLLYYWEDFFEYEDVNPVGIYCLSETTVQIILSALRFARWPTRWRLDRLDRSRAIDDQYVDTIQAWADLAQAEVIKDMSCDFEQGLQAIAEAIAGASNAEAINNLADAVLQMANQQCCDQNTINITNGGVVTTITDGEGATIPIYGSQPPATLGEGEFPDNYETEEAYLADKCRLANMVFDGWLGTMRGLGAITVFNATALAALIGLALASIIVFPPAALPIMIGLLIGLGGFVAMFVVIADNLEENREQIVCDLYLSDTVESAILILSDALDIVISLIEVSGPVGVALKSAAMLLVNSDTMSQLFNGAAALGYPDADCSGCECDTFQVDAGGLGGEILEQTSTTITLTPYSYPDRNRYDAYVSFFTAEYFGEKCGPTVEVTNIEILSGEVTTCAPPNGAGVYQLYSNEDMLVYSNVTPPTLPQTAKVAGISSCTTFTVRFTISEV